MKQNTKQRIAVFMRRFITQKGTINKIKPKFSFEDNNVENAANTETEKQIQKQNKEFISNTEYNDTSTGFKQILLQNISEKENNESIGCVHDMNSLFKGRSKTLHFVNYSL